MSDLHAFFNDHTGITDWRDDSGNMLGMDRPDGIGGIIHTDAHGMLVGHSHPDGLGCTTISDTSHAQVASVHHDALGTTISDAHGTPLAHGRPNIFHGNELFLPDGSHLGGTMDLGGGHTVLHGDPLVGMSTIRFPLFQS